MFMKALPVFLGTYVASAGTAAFQGAEITDLASLEAQLPALLLSIGFGAFMAGKNAWKNRALEGSPFYDPHRSSLLPLFAGALLILSCTGCQSINGPDGTVITSPDLGAITTLYGFWVAEQERLEEAGALKDERKEAARQVRLAELNRLIAALAEQFRVSNIRFGTSSDGTVVLKP